MKNLLKLKMVNDSDQSFSIGDISIPMRKTTVVSVNRHTANNIVISATDMEGVSVSVIGEEQGIDTGGFVPASELQEMKKAKDQAEEAIASLTTEKQLLENELLALREQLANSPEKALEQKAEEPASEPEPAPKPKTRTKSKTEVEAK